MRSSHLERALASGNMQLAALILVDAALTVVARGGGSQATRTRSGTASTPPPCPTRPVRPSGRPVSCPPPT